MSIEALQIHISGVVQGVGFRPFVYREACARHIAGWVQNAVDGVTVHAEGEPDAIDALVVAISEEAPAAAQVSEIEMDEVPVEGFSDFEIRFSDVAPVDATTLVSPDLATCDACVNELFDLEDRRYRYPFINCTNCGPRFTIMRGLPYDRPATSMADFKMCPGCAAEYADPANRRFHAQPDACFTCGPHLGWAVSSDVLSAPYVEGTDADLAPFVNEAADERGILWAQGREQSDAVLAAAVHVLRAGGIVAVKGLGGYHLACDADNAEAVARLRERKHRPGKPLAVMAATLDAVCERCSVSDAEAAQLTSPARPIVLLHRLPHAPVGTGLADGLPELGCMLPATPVQHLLLHDFGGVLVMTSGNLHDEPIVTDEASALDVLAGGADAFVVNDRAIEGRYDDSVVRVLDGGPAGEIVQMTRRARGFAPQPLAIPVPADGTPAQVFAVGPEQKNTFTYTRGALAFVSQHIGDIESAATWDAWNETRQRFSELFRLAPERVAYDRHPEYLTTKWALNQELPTIPVQHHHAHVLSVMGENGLEGPVCGFAFDGTGYGLDGALWGGEVILSNLTAYERFANFAYLPLPGGAAAIKEPARIAYGALWDFDLLDHPAAQQFVSDHVPDAEMFQQMIERGINCPQTSSVGRLFDAVSALLDVCTHPRYEGEAAVLLEAAMGNAQPAGEYRFELVKNTATEQSTAADTSVLLIDAAPVFVQILDDVTAGVPVGSIARSFHDAIVDVMATLAELVRATYGIDVIALAGGVFMNRYLAEQALAQLQQRGFTVALNRDLPPNDGALSYGQAVLALQARTEE